MLKMASESEASCESDPNFAVICAFLEKFGVTCGITNIDFVELQEMLENTQEVSPELIDLHIKLLRKARKSVSSERWERAVIKLCHGYCSQDAWEIERFGYKKARLASKLRILKELLEMQFDFNTKFKAEINKLSAEELRTQPVGKDRLGHAYWLQCDESCQVRVYKEDPDEETWALVARDRNGLISLITQLKTNDTIKVGSEPIVNEDSNSLEVEKPLIDTGQSTESDSSKASQEEQSQDATKNETGNISSESIEDMKEEEQQDAARESETQNDDNKYRNVDNEVEKKMTGNEEAENESNDLATDLSHKPTLRIRSISELMGQPAVDVQRELIGVKDKYIRSEPNMEHRIPRLKVSMHSSLHRRAIHSAGFNTADIKTTLKRTVENDDIEDVHEVKRSRLNRPTLLGNKKSTKAYSDEEIEEPVMMVSGEGSGYENESRNPIVGEEIEETVMYFVGEGNGRDCETGNETEDQKSETTNSINECKCVNNSVVDKKCECSQKVRSQIKLGTIIDVRTDNNCKPASKSPTKKSRWDIGKPPDEIENSEATPSETCFKIPHSRQVDSKIDSKGKVYDLVVKSEMLSSSSKDDDQQNSQEYAGSAELNSTTKQPVFYFGPRCLQFKTSTVNSVPSKSNSCDHEKNKDSEETSDPCINKVEKKKIIVEAQPKKIVSEQADKESETQALQCQKIKDDFDKVSAEKTMVEKTIKLREETVMDQLDKRDISVHKAGVCNSFEVVSNLPHQDTTTQHLEAPASVNAKRSSITESDTKPEDSSVSSIDVEFLKTDDNIIVQKFSEVEANDALPCVRNERSEEVECRIVYMHDKKENQGIEDPIVPIHISETPAEKVGENTLKDITADALINKAVDRCSQSHVVTKHVDGLVGSNEKLAATEYSENVESTSTNEKSETHSTGTVSDSLQHQVKKPVADVSVEAKSEQLKEMTTSTKEPPVDRSAKKSVKEVSEISNLQHKNSKKPAVTAEKVLSSEKSGRVSGPLPSVHSSSGILRNKKEKALPLCKIAKEADLELVKLTENYSECSKTPEKEKYDSKQLCATSTKELKNVGNTCGIKDMEGNSKTLVAAEICEKTKLDIMETNLRTEKNENDQSGSEQMLEKDAMEHSNLKTVNKTEVAENSSSETPEQSKLEHLESSSTGKMQDDSKESKTDAQKLIENLSSNASKEVQSNFEYQKVDPKNTQQSEIVQVAEDKKLVNVKVTEECKKEIENTVNHRQDTKVEIFPVMRSTAMNDFNMKEDREARFAKETLKDTKGETAVTPEKPSLSHETSNTEVDSEKLDIGEISKGDKTSVPVTENNADDLTELIERDKKITKEVLCGSILEQASTCKTEIPIPSEPCVASANKQSTLKEPLENKNYTQSESKKDEAKAVEESPQVAVKPEESKQQLTKVDEIQEKCQPSINEENETKGQQLNFVDEKKPTLKLDDVVNDQKTNLKDQLVCSKELNVKITPLPDTLAPPSKSKVESMPSVDVSTKRNLRGRRGSDYKISQSELQSSPVDIKNDADEPSKKVSKLEPEKRVTRGSGGKSASEVNEEETPKQIEADITKGSELKHPKTQKKAPKKIGNEAMATRRNTRSRSLKTEENTEELKPVDEPKCVKKHVPLLTVVSLSKLTGKPEVLEESVLANDGTDSDDIVTVPETDPLACSEEEVQKAAPPALTLSSFSLDVEEEIAPIHIPTRKTRKRGHEIKVETTEVAEKKQKLRGKRPVDVELRRSIEEQKRLVASSSDDDNGAQDFAVAVDEDDQEEEEEPTPKKVTRRGRKKKIKRSFPVKRIASSPVSSSDVLSETSRADSVNTPPVTKKGRGPSKKTLLGLEIPSKTENVAELVTGVRQSRRIAQIKIKEEAERRKLEEIALNEIQADLKKSKGKKREDKDFKPKLGETKKRSKHQTEDDEDTPEPEMSDDKKKRKRKRKHRNPNKIFDEHNPWRSSSDSSTSNEDEEEEVEEVYSEEEPAPLLKSDHEFSPESDMEDTSDVQPMKRARTARKESDVEEEVDDCACQKCGQTDHPEWILLCDGCDNGWHCSCLRPALLVIPEGDWHCPPCQHTSLIKNFEERLVEYDKKLSRKDVEDRRKERLAYVGISLNNVLPAKEPDTKVKHKNNAQSDGSESEQSDGSGSDSSSSSDSDSEPIYQLRERRQAHSYRFNDYDELINSAIQDEIDAVKGAGNQGKGKDIATIVNAEKEEEAQRLKMTVAPEPLPPVVPRHETEHTESKNDDDDSDDAPIHPIKKKFGRKKSRKLNSLDVSSGDDADSDEDFKGTSSTDEEEDLDDMASESSDDSTRVGRRRGGPVRRSTRARTSRYDREFINDNDSDEEEAPRRKKTRSIWDESESEESDRSWGRKKKGGGRSSRRKSVSKPKKSKKKKKAFDDSDSEIPKRKKKPKIKYGRIESDDETTGRRTRGKKINYLDVLGSDSDDDGVRRKSAKAIESEEEYVANEDEELDPDDLEHEKSSDAENQSESEEDEAVPAVIPKLKVKPLKEPSPEPVQDEQSENMKRLAEEMQATVDSFKDSSPNNALEDNLKSYETEPNPIDVINKNMEEMNEQEMEKMMEEEEYANKQLQLVALQIEKEKKRKEREAKKLEMLTIQPDLSSKKRSRKAKNLDFPPISQTVGMMNSEFQNNAELSEPPGVSLPIFGDIGGLNSSPEDTPKKRRGRGKGKKTLAAEQAAAATRPIGDIPNSSMNIENNLKTAVMNMSSPSLPPQDPSLQGNNIGIAAPPQPFSQSQPAPSVITRMLQSQPGQGGYPVTGSPSYYPRNEQQHVPDVPASGVQGTPGQYVQGAPRVQVPNPYRQGPPASMPPHYPPLRNNPAIPHQVRPPGAPQLYHHPHHSLDPSPSGGGSINIPTDRTSPAIIPPPSDSPMGSKSEPPPPQVYSRPHSQQMPTRFPTTNNSPGRHLHMMSPHGMQQAPRTNSMPPYPPSGMPAYYNSYPPPPPQPSMEAGEEMLGYHTSSPYSEQFANEGGALGENSNSKSFEEESGGEFGGLVSYFSSQREDDLDT